MKVNEDITEMMYCEDLRRQVYSLKRMMNTILDRLFTLETKLSSVDNCVCNAQIKNRRYDSYIN